MNETNISNPVPNLLGKREPAPSGIRFPVELKKRLIALAKEQGLDFSTYTLYLLRAAVADLDKKRPLKRAV